MFKWPVCLVRVAWFASMACSLVNMPALMLVVRPLLCLLALAFLLNGTCACGQFAVSKVAYGWIARAPPLTLSKKLWSLVHVGSGRIRAASIWLRAALFGGGMHLDVLFATQLAFFFSRSQRSRALTWSTCRGSPAHAFDSWLVSQCFAWLGPDSWMEVDSFWFRLLFGSFFRRWHRSASACCWRRLACLVLASSHGIRATGCSAWLLAWCCWMFS